MKIMKAPLMVLMPLVAMTGCGTGVSSRIAGSSSLYQMNGNSGYAVTYDSRGRGAYVAVTERIERDENKNPIGKFLQLKLCAEPTPDASANLGYNSQTRASVDASLTYQAVTAGAKVGVDNIQAITSTLADVAQRTELVLVMRDMLYRVCELHLNGVLDNDKTAAAFAHVIGVTAVLGQRDTVGRLLTLLANKDAQLAPAAQLTLSNAISSLVGSQIVNVTGVDAGTTRDATKRMLDNLFPTSNK